MFYARICSIFEKSKIELSQIHKFTNSQIGELNINKSEIDLMRELISYNNAIKSVVDTYNPSYLCKKLLDIANAYNNFYQGNRILDIEDKNLKSFRLLLSEATQDYIKHGLDLLGINVLNKM